jgi:hypothetical protein
MTKMEMSIHSNNPNRRHRYQRNLNLSVQKKFAESALKDLEVTVSQ